ncbi:MAG: GDSL-type esterase/lipase family protein [Bacteroidota bacterium]
MITIIKNMQQVVLLILCFLAISCKPELDIKNTRALVIPENPDSVNEFNVYLYPDDIQEKQDATARFNAYLENDNVVISGEVYDEQVFVNNEKVFSSDRVEIYLSSFRGSTNRLRYIILPPGEKNEAKVIVHDWRTSREARLKIPPINASAELIEKGYRFKAVVPLSELGEHSSRKKHFGMQMVVADADGGNEELQFSSWFHVNRLHMNTLACYQMKVGSNVSPDFKHGVKGNIEHDTLFLKIQHDENHLEVRYADTIIYLTSSSPEVIKIHLQDPFITGEITKNGETIDYFDSRLMNRTDIINSPPYRYEQDIVYFEAMGDYFGYAKNNTLFIGSSSIREWYTLPDDFSGQIVYNRGFGGSIAAEALWFAERIVIPAKPSKIVYFEGDNDIAMGIPVADIIHNVKGFIDIVTDRLPGTEIYLLSVKPSIARRHLMHESISFNQKLDSLAATYEHVTYIDIFLSMMQKNGNIREDIWQSDSLHMNDTGYAIWAEEIGRFITR